MYQPINRIPLPRGLFWWSNVVLGIIHASSALVIGLLVPERATVPLLSHLPGKRPLTDPRLWRTEEVLQGQVQVGHFATAFLALAALNHWYTVSWGWESYQWNVGQGRNPIRWLEYAFSASLMHVHVAMLSGCMDIHTLFLIFGLTATTMTFGWLAEPTSQRPKSVTPFWTGFVPYTFQWLVIFCVFFSAVSKSNPPDFVWAILFIILILDLSFALNMYLYLSDQITFPQCELVYGVLSLVSKQSLAWINYGGTMSLLK